MGSPSRNVQDHPPRLSEDRLNLPQPHSPSLPTHCSGKSGMRPPEGSAQVDGNVAKIDLAARGVDGALVHFNAPSWAVRAVMSSTTLPVCPKTGSTSPSLTVHLCLHTVPGNRECALMHARLARAGMHLPRKTHHVAKLEERLHEAQGAALEAVLDIGIESGGSSHREIQTQPERTAREKPQLADERRNDERRGQVAKTPVWAYRFVGVLALVRYVCRGIPDEAAARPRWRSTAALHETAVEPVSSGSSIRADGLLDPHGTGRCRHL